MKTGEKFDRLIDTDISLMVEQESEIFLIDFTKNRKKTQAKTRKRLYIYTIAAVELAFFNFGFRFRRLYSLFYHRCLCFSCDWSLSWFVPFFLILLLTFFEISRGFS